jgi:uncharacterized protein (TIGR02391 family)
VLEQAIEQGRRWLNSNEAWDSSMNLAGIGFLCATFRRMGDPISGQIVPKVIEGVTQLWKRGINKFSRLNDPAFMFGIAIGVGDQFPEDLGKDLKHHCLQNAQPGNWRRQLLFAAAAFELNVNISPFLIDTQELEVYDVFPALWFVERYPKLIKGDEARRNIWETFDRVKDGISLETSPASNASLLYTASPLDIAMLFEALLHQTHEIDPVTLFNNMRWHPEVRRVSESLFVKGEYVSSVLEASKLFIEAVKTQAGHPTDSAGQLLDGFKLMERVFVGKSPILKFNAMSNPSEIDEQRGLGHIAEGVVSAFRNPKGHIPALSIFLEPHEALEQLSTISYLMKRLDLAHK